MSIVLIDKYVSVLSVDGQECALLSGDKPRWLLVGMSGRVGQMLTALWVQSPPSDIQLVYQSRKSTASDQAALNWAPNLGASLLGSYIQQQGPISGMVMMAGVTSGSDAELSMNAQIAVDCLEAAKTVKIPKVLIASSSAVYGAGQERSFCEEDTACPKNAYGRAKLSMEVACAPFRSKNLSITCMRIGNVAGADALLRNAANATVKEPLVLDCFADGNGPARSYIGPKTLIEVLGTLMRSKRLPDVMNVAAPRPVAMQELLDSGKTPWTFRPAAQDAQQNIILDCGLLSDIHDFSEVDSTADEMISQVKRSKALIDFEIK